MVASAVDDILCAVELGQEDAEADRMVLNARTGEFEEARSVSNALLDTFIVWLINL